MVATWEGKPMTIAPTSSGSQKSEYQDYKERMWDAFSRLNVSTRLSILVEESWPFLIFAFGYLALPIVSAQAQARGGQAPPPGIAAIIYLALVAVLLACVLFLLFSGRRWGKVHSWAAKTATFLLGFLTKASQQFV
jgi:hypothetical protein